ncbi:adenine phosphoribosyltransferase [Carboxydothermus hydrogenoformans]|uniref:Adenine phosphoribosyltransferase n=1 Tax=Carboxydothermus hydrogenoformans (strain ATCC BAA-161 / DSM 6008 / Z-2901) TaxID=246194 RepID=APT_CARHZ|nr:adenine phosphoribosyltransferase [Carboxydothermus hydrogenoformans]Q3AAI8.1 RecName: Full=Adenine phosphoribosyltransferase; Short=APRT [Carboxydothermus hydrogenoformans Z-2901]ABB14678.1 adenine phosphoribosyltransferase [Carboxydothermus hydrogenoformans Z-2901]
MDLKKYIYDIPDFPSPGIIFRDITPLLQNPETFRRTVELLAEKVVDLRPTHVVAIESRGFMFGAPLAYKLGLGFVPVRKEGKLPRESISVSYDLEYGNNTLEIHTDALKPGDRVVIVDDVLATGGTMKATVELCERLGAKVEALLFVIELLALEGRKKLTGKKVISLVQY